MSTTVTYKGNTIATVSNNTKTLETEGKYLEADIILTDDSEPTISSLTVTPTTSQQTFNSSSVDGYKPVVVNAMPSGTAGTPSASKGTVSNHSVSVTPSVTNTTGYITGGTKTGTGVTVSASELVSGTYTVSASGTKDVTNYASISVASGSATASATKSAVSNHSVTVTPSVTTTAGYVTAGSSSGTAVSVSASELVSGSQTLSDNGTYDVTNLAEVVVDVQGGGGGGLTLLKTESLGTLSTSSSSGTDTGKSITVTGYSDYDLLVVDVSVDTPTNGRHTSTVSLVFVTGTTMVTSKNTYSVVTNKWNSKLSSAGAASTRQNTVAYGIYVNGATVSNSTMTLIFYYKYNSSNTGTINGTYTARVYGIKLFDLIGG